MPKKSDYVISRRGFVGGVLGLVSAIISAVVGLPVIGYIVSPAFKRGGGEEWVTLGPVSAVEPGTPTPLTFSQTEEVGWRRERINHTIYAVTNNDETVTVFSDVCTHLSCKVHWEEERGVFVCPCHDGIYDKEGNVISGPPPKPLSRFETRLEGDQLMILVEA